MPGTQNSPICVEPERQTEPPPEKPAPANPLRRIALGVVILIAVLFTLSIFMERRTPSTSQAVVQAYVVEMAAEVGAV
jgi:multidrug resistance efflux pump